MGHTRTRLFISRARLSADQVMSSMMLRCTIHLIQEYPPFDAQISGYETDGMAITGTYFSLLDTPCAKERAGIE